VDVVEHDHQRTPGGEDLEELAERPEGLLDPWRHVRQAEQRGQALTDQLRILGVLQQLEDLRPGRLG
jgi:hypothetical protein